MELQLVATALLTPNASRIQIFRRLEANCFGREIASV